MMPILQENDDFCNFVGISLLYMLRCLFEFKEVRTKEEVGSREKKKMGKIEVH